jgi:hypothetical protein
MKYFLIKNNNSFILSDDKSMLLTELIAVYFKIDMHENHVFILKT